MKKYFLTLGLLVSIATSSAQAGSFYFNCNNISAEPGQPNLITVGGIPGANGEIVGAFFDSRSMTAMGVLNSGVFLEPGSNATHWNYNKLDIISSSTLHYTNATLYVDGKGSIIQAVFWISSEIGALRKAVFGQCKESSPLVRTSP